MSLILDPRTTALVLIDLQNGILAIPLAPHSAAQILANATTLARRLTELGGTVVLVHVAFADNYADRPNRPVDQPMQAPPGGWPAGWSEFSPDIGALHADVIITKRQWGAFHGTELDLQLRRRGIDTILLGGVATNFGVESTAREGWQHNYAVVVAEDASTSIGEQLHRFSVETILPRVSRVRSTAEILTALHSA